MAPLCQALLEALTAQPRSFEIILVNDGSADRTEQKLAEAAATDSRIRVVNFRSNKGQTAAMMAGIDYAAGNVIVPMDGDLQNDPKDIVAPAGEARRGLRCGLGLAARPPGQFHDPHPAQQDRQPGLISRVSGVPLHDYGCTPEGLPPRSAAGFPPVWRDAPLHPDLSPRRKARA